MPDQHRVFYGQLPFIVLAGVAPAGWPCASILCAPPGFVSTPDAHTLRIDARPVPGDPLAEALCTGARIAGLGIDFATRRRNRFAGRVAEPGPPLLLAVEQAFGNCPKYIQAREPEFIRDPNDARFVPHREELREFDGAARHLIASADAFFIATAAPGGHEAGALGADVSHRGGKPGFVRIDDARTLSVPDFAGNNYFNTFGNLLLNPCAGLLFVDFATGDVLQLAGTGEVVLDPQQTAVFRGAERLLRFRLDRGVRLREALPIRFRFLQYSPNVLGTGDWKEAGPAGS